jgi:hypothetical protein
MPNATKGSIEAFRARLLADRPADMEFAEQVITWAINKPLARRWSSASEVDSLTCRATIGLQDHKILTLETNGLVWILFTQLLSTFPSSDATTKKGFHKHLVGRLGKIPGGNTAPGSYKAKASWRLSDTDLPAFLEVADWIVLEVKKAQVTAVALHAAKRARNQ